MSQLELAVYKRGQTSHQLQNGKNSIIMSRTCRQVRDGDPSLTSGMYWIDPDGQGNWGRPHLRLLRHGDRFHRSTSHTKLLA